MKTATVFKEFASKAALADALGVRPQAVSNWHETIPVDRFQTHRAKIIVLTKGKVQPSPTDIHEWEEQIDLLRSALRFAKASR